MSTDRIFQGEDQQWYFNVRGNQAVGPFVSLTEAEGALNRHVKSCVRRTQGGVGWPSQLTPSRLLRKPRAAARHS
jgi:hypothetical protein